MDHKVWIGRVSGYEDTAALDAAVEAVFAASPAVSCLCAESRVLLKPNLLAKHTPEQAVTTHPAVLGAVIRAVKRRGVPASRIICADSMGGIYTPGGMKSIYHISGLDEACAVEDVTCYTDCKWQPRNVENAALVQEFNLIEPVLDADFIIDLPKMKTHVMTGCTAATKNLFGCIPGLQKAELHTRFPKRENFGDMLIDLYGTVKPDLAVLDAVFAMEGDGPAGGTPRKVGLILGSEDCLNLDLAVCGLMGLAPMRVPYLEAAHNRGLCAEAFDAKDLIGTPEAFKPLPDYKLPSSYVGGTGSTDFADHTAFGFVVRAAEKMVAPRPVIEQNKCIGCGKCAEICPQHTIVMSEKTPRKAKIEPRACIRCFCCHEMCPAKAIAVRRMPIFKL